MNDVAKQCYDAAIRFEGGEPCGILVRAGDTIMSLTQQRDELLADAKLTLEENGHLADGDNCTLKVLRDAVEKIEGVK